MGALPFCSRSFGDILMHLMKQHTEKGKPGLWLDTKQLLRQMAKPERHRAGVQGRAGVSWAAEPADSSGEKGQAVHGKPETWRLGINTGAWRQGGEKPKQDTHE